MYEKRLKQLQSYSSFLPVRSLAWTSNVSVLRVRLCQELQGWSCLRYIDNLEQPTAKSRKLQRGPWILSPRPCCSPPAYLRFILPYLHRQLQFLILSVSSNPLLGITLKAEGSCPLKWLTPATDTHSCLTGGHCPPFGGEGTQEKRGLRLCPPPPPPARFQCFFSIESLAGGGLEIP